MHRQKVIHKKRSITTDESTKIARILPSDFWLDTENLNKENTEIHVIW